MRTVTTPEDTAFADSRSADTWQAHNIAAAVRLAETDVYTHSQVDLARDVPYTYAELFEKVTDRVFNENNSSDAIHDEVDMLTIADAYVEAFQQAGHVLELVSANETVPH